ncbi:hypothetical protein CH380_05615 [Leptospira adleri]|uniref:Uncharacterized protein n=1 Tax=Leptospira adleri TaxID=2023186 RepID=A0A2M9YR36_9LEPT|nr:hypothetical protein CH380_05615 [Leptospira adleri]PJZ63325.1 hypothetical protein CH376_03540 [Leptospira adleri]
MIFKTRLEKRFYRFTTERSLLDSSYKQIRIVPETLKKPLEQTENRNVEFPHFTPLRCDFCTISNRSYAFKGRVSSHISGFEIRL